MPCRFFSLSLFLLFLFLGCSNGSGSDALQAGCKRRLYHLLRTRRRDPTHTLSLLHLRGRRDRRPLPATPVQRRRNGGGEAAAPWRLQPTHLLSWPQENRSCKRDTILFNTVVASHLLSFHGRALVALVYRMPRVREACVRVNSVF